MEIWKDLVGYEGMYQVSNLGNVKSLSRPSFKGKIFFKSKEIILKACNNNLGYYTVVLCKPTGKKTRNVHQLVAEAFLNHVPCRHKLVVNHKNFIKSDNRVENLEIITQRENANHKHIKHSSQYTGVSWVKKDKKWKSGINICGKMKHLGYFTNEIDAHNAYQTALNTL